MNDTEYDRLLNIQTCGIHNGIYQSIHYNRYEPTPYSALEELLNNYEITKKDHVVDFGCGLGRLNFFLHYRVGASVMGIEMNEQFVKESLKNRRSYLKKHKKPEEQIQFQCCLAEDYTIQLEENKFYFFNPFSMPIFIKVLNNIMLSVEQRKRTVDVILFYPTEDYRFYLEHQTPFELIKEISIEQSANPLERFLIYRLNI